MSVFRFILGMAYFKWTCEAGVIFTNAWKNPLFRFRANFATDGALGKKNSFCSSSFFPHFRILRQPHTLSRFFRQNRNNLHSFLSHPIQSLHILLCASLPYFVRSPCCASVINVFPYFSRPLITSGTFNTFSWNGMSLLQNSHQPIQSFTSDKSMFSISLYVLQLPIAANDLCSRKCCPISHMFLLV